MSQRLLETSSSLQDHSVTLLKYVSDIPTWAANRSGTAPACSFSMSNLGVFDGLDKTVGSGRHGLMVENMIFSQSADGTGAPFNVNFASTKHGALAMTLTWWPGMLGLEDEAGFTRSICTSVATQAGQISESETRGAGW